MAHIQTIPAASATGEVLAMYERQRAHFGYLPNYATVFCYRPDVMASWAGLIRTIRGHVDPRRFELVTLAAAQALGNTYCALAHGKALAEIVGSRAVRGIVDGTGTDTLAPAERAMIAFARKVARDATSVTPDDAAQLRTHGFGDDEIFDIVAVAAARAFFTKVLDGLGAEPDAAYRELDDPLRRSLTAVYPTAHEENAERREQAG